MARSPILVGAHVVVYVNGTMFGRVAGLSHSMDSPIRELHGVDTYLPIELVRGPVSIRGNMTLYRLHNDGGLESAGMIGTWNDLTREKYFSILVLDRSTDTVVFRADRCGVSSQNWTYGKGYVMGNVGFNGLLWTNETPDSTS